MHKRIICIQASTMNQMLLDQVENLLSYGIEIVVVNDGDKQGGEYAQKIAAHKVHIIDHYTELGKGAAIKTGLNYISCHYQDFDQVLSIDADSEYDARVLASMLEKSEDFPQQLILLSRTYSDKAPFFTRLGKRLTKFLFKLSCGQGVVDVHGGVRIIPKKIIATLLGIKSMGWEFLIDMVVLAKRSRVNIVEVPMVLTYDQKHQRGLFVSLLESMRLSFLLVRFSIVGIVTALIDYFMFFVIYAIYPSLPVSLTGARLVSVFANYFAVKQFAFHNAGHIRETLPKYLLLATVSVTLGYALVNGLTNDLHLHLFMARIITDLVLFFVNFIIQRDFIFKRQLQLEN